MSTLNKQTIQEKMSKLEEAIKILNELKTVPQAEFSNDFKTNSAVMFNLVISIELIVDIGNHILSQVFQKPAKTYKDTIAYLGDVGVVPKEFAQENKDMADFRNKLIHDYDRVTLDAVYDNFQKAPDVFRQFAKYFVEFMEKQAE